MKTILACLTTEEHTPDILAAALPLARRKNSHLIGLHTLEALAIYPGIWMHVPEDIYIDFSESQEATSDAIREAFENRVRTEDFVWEWRGVKAQSMTAADRMVDAARTSDLVIMAQADETADRADQYHAQEHVIRQSGRPVLHVPRGFRGENVGSSVVIGWSLSREAARAVHDALPLMEPGSKAWIVTVAQGETRAYDGATELARALDRHGIEAEVVQRTAEKPHIAKVLQAEALERGADLIVTGAFGHSRLYDFVVGAVTLELMRDATVPVLFSR